MPKLTSTIRELNLKRVQSCAVECNFVLNYEATSLGAFFSIVQSVVDQEREFWFRGHGSMEYKLVPSALRQKTSAERSKALNLIEEMKRHLEFKINRPPLHDDKIGWIQVAQHYGLPTRLLDWTLNVAAALYFACSSNPDNDGAVYAMDPCELNSLARNGDDRILNPRSDAITINRYLDLDGQRRGNLATVAIKPTYNTERIQLQQGAFTLHGSQFYEITRKHTPSLIGVPIPKESKLVILKQLQRVGVSEMTLFPEPEHVCSDIRRRSNL